MEKCWAAHSGGVYVYDFFNENAAAEVRIIIIIAKRMKRKRIERKENDRDEQWVGSITIILYSKQYYYNVDVDGIYHDGSERYGLLRAYARWESNE